MNIDDRYAKIREALEMRPTPGPWEVANGTDVFTQLGARNAARVEAAANDGWHIADCDMGPSSTEEGKADIPYVEKRANAALIAACDPDTIRELLAERDALAAEVEALEKMGFVVLSRSEVEAIREKAIEEEAENERLKREIAATQEKLIRANDELIQRNSKALSSTGAVKVKALEWEETHTRRSEEDPTTEWDGGFKADSVLGYYEISMGFGSDAYYWAVTNPLGDDVGSNFEDPSYAKAAAQADYERRILSAIEAAPPASEGRQDDKPLAYIVHAPEDDYYGTGPDSLQFHPLAQHDLDRGYRQTPLYARPAPELTGNTGELIDRMAEAIRGDTTSDETPWATLSEDRKEGWRGDAERALAVVKEYLTARLPASRTVTEEMVERAFRDGVRYGTICEVTDIDEAWRTSAVRAALKAAMEARNAE